MELADHFLIAMPSVHESLFSGSVVYITEHQPYVGAIGVVINRLVSRTLVDMFKDINLSDYNIPWENSNLYWGGPIKSRNGFFLRKSERLGYSKYELTGNQQHLKEFTVHKDGFFMSVGYSSWAPLQLEAEISCNAWMIVKSSPDLIFSMAPEVRYREALKMIGINNLSQFYCDHTMLEPT